MQDFRVLGVCWFSHALYAKATRREKATGEEKPGHCECKERRSKGEEKRRGEKEIGLNDKEERGLFCDGESGGDGGGDCEAERGAAAAGEGAGGQRGGSAARLTGQHSHRCLPLRNGLQGPKHPLPAACRCLPLSLFLFSVLSSATRGKGD